jgi:hypothetical protein
MRIMFTLAVLAAVGSVASAEELKGITIQPRYGVEASPEFYPQGTPKEALATAAKLLEKQRYSYLLAHVIDPAFVDAEVAARAKGLEPAVEKQLAAVRADQKRNLPVDTPAERVISADPAAFAQQVRAEAERQAFGELVKAMQDNLGEFPEHVTQLLAVAAAGTVAENGQAATAEAKGVPGKKVFLKQGAVAALKEVKVIVDNLPATRFDPATVQRWFVEDRQQDAAKPKAEK